MIINGKTEENLNILADYPSIDKSSYFSNQTIWESGLIPSRARYKEKYRNFKCKFAILGNNKDEITKNASKFIEEVKNCTVEYENFIYELDLNADSITPNCFETAESIELNFNIVDMHEAEKSITTTQNTTININSPKECYANLELNATTNVISYTIKINDNDIVVNKIKGNETVYIGSGKVLAGGKSKINDVDIWEFPILKPGTNKIEVNRADVDLTIKYCERW